MVAEVSSMWATHGPRLLAVADRAERLAAATAWSATTPVLCHGDPHHGNLLVDGDGQVWLVDWDDAVVAPREADLMFVVGGVFSHAPVTGEQVRRFFDGYTPVTGVGLGAGPRPAGLPALRAGPGRRPGPVRGRRVPSRPHRGGSPGGPGYACRTLAPGGLVALALG